MGITNLTCSEAEPQRSESFSNIESHKDFEKLVSGIGILPKYIPVQRIKDWMEISSAVDDASLLARIAQGDQLALSTLYDRYARVMYAIALKSLRSVEESEEVVLDVFAQVWRIADRYDVQRGKPDTWLFTLTRSRVLDRIRRLQRFTSSTIISLDAVEIQPKANNVDLFEQAAMTERRSHVLAAMKVLPEEQRTVIALAYYQGLTHSEIATQTGLSLGTVKTRIRLGLNKLKSALSNEENLNKTG